MNSDIDTSTPNSARIYDHLLGGKDNFAADRQAAAALLRKFPTAAAAARANRRFMARVVRILAQEHGLRQFVDLGTGMPTVPNVHQVAQAVHPGARIVYVDKDPLVITHARALLTGEAAGRTAYIQADISDPAAILGNPDFRRAIDLGLPMVVLLVAVLHFLPDPVPDEVLRQWIDVLPPGSHIVLSHFTADLYDPEQTANAREVATRMGTGLTPRSHADLTRMLHGTTLLDPGIVSVPLWRPDQAETTAGLADTDVNMWAAVARCG